MNVKVTDNSDGFKTALLANRDRGLEIIGLLAEGYAKRLCPVDTSNLRNSITHATREQDVYIGTNVEYAPYVELGTVNTNAQPFLRPAAADHLDEYRAILLGCLRD